MLSHSYFLAAFAAFDFLLLLSLTSGRTFTAPVVFQDNARAVHMNMFDTRCQEAPLSNPLQYCPKGSVFVSQKNPKASFRSIGSALESLPDDGKARTILIDQGIYHEKVVLSRISPTILAGITSNPHEPNSNRVQIWQSSYVNQSDPQNMLSNCDAVVLSVGTGSAVGNRDFKAYNIDFTQRQFQNGVEVKDRQLGPSAALCVQNSNASFYGCSFNSYQDTVYVGSSSQAFFFKSIVRGMTDQLYGMGKAWFERTLLLSRACGGGITAWRGDPEDPLVGVYISNSEIALSQDASTLEGDLTGKCHLGRPWNIYSHSTYLNTKMSNIVAKAGFKVWGAKQSNFDPKLTRFAEYKSYGPGGDEGGRHLGLERILNHHEAKQITWRNVFGGSAPWVDAKTVNSW